MTKNKNENLMPIELVNASKTPEERKQAAAKAGRRSGEVKRQRKVLKELFESLLKTSITDEAMKKELKDNGFKDEEQNYNTLLGVSMLTEAIKGNTKAFELIRDTIGEKPKEEVIVEVNSSTSDEIEKYINGKRKN